jgi:hypothetical protein
VAADGAEIACPVVVLVVDVANVMGSRPDGWWKDRAGAASRLLASLVPLTGQVVEAASIRPASTASTAPAASTGPGGADVDPGPRAGPVELARIVAVIEGQARRAVLPPELEVVAAPRDGDSAIVECAERLVGAGEVPLVVTADRGLRQRLPAGSRTAGPGWLLGLL